MTDKKVIVIAGPNGAGKSTFAQAFLPAEAQCPTFINADLIASGLSPFAPELAAMKAGRIMLEEMDIASAKSADLRASMAAMKRAADLARSIAIRTNTGIVIIRDNKLVTVLAQELSTWPQVFERNKP